MANAAVTRCPHCGTKFRVSTQQLKVAQGAVRCGACLHIFNAEDHLTAPLGNPQNPAPRAKTDQTVPPPSLPASPAQQETVYEPAFGEHNLEDLMPKETPPLRATEDEADESWALEMLAEIEAEAERGKLTTKQPQEQQDFAAEVTPSQQSSATAIAPSLPQDAEAPPQEAGQPVEQDTSEQEESGVTETAEPTLNNTEPSTDLEGAHDPFIADNQVATTAETSPPLEPSPPDTKSSTDSADSHSLEPALTDHQEPTIGDEFDLANSADQAPEAEGKAYEPQWGNQGEEPEPTWKTEPQIETDLDAAVVNRAEEHPLASDGSTINTHFDTDPLQLAPVVQNHPRWLRWVGLNLLLLALLAAQYSYFNWRQLATHPELRPWLAGLCAPLDCQLPLLSDLSKIEKGSLVVRSHPNQANALILDAVIQNKADFPQPFPYLQIKFANLRGRTLAARTFRPSEYLGGELTGETAMPPNTPVQLSLEIVDPGKEATNYSLDFYPIRPASW